MNKYLKDKSKKEITEGKFTPRTYRTTAEYDGTTTIWVSYEVVEKGTTQDADRWDKVIHVKFEVDNGGDCICKKVNYKTYENKKIPLDRHNSFPPEAPKVQKGVQYIQ